MHRLGDAGQLPRPGLLLLLRELRRALLELRRALPQGLLHLRGFIAVSHDRLPLMRR